MYTVESVKEKLPDVQLIDTKTKIKYTGMVRGRKCQFPVVYVNDTNLKFEYAWETIRDCLNDGRPLQF